MIIKSNTLEPIEYKDQGKSITYYSMQPEEYYDIVMQPENVEIVEGLCKVLDEIERKRPHSVDFNY